MLRASEPPDDPGEQTTAATAGFFVGGGGRWANTAGVSATMGIEARLSRSTNPYSTNPKAAGYTPLALPWDAGHSLAIGAALAQHDGLGWHVGAVYAEAQRFVAWLGAGAGYAWEPTSEAHGPQATLWVGPLWLSSRYLWHDGLQLHLGIAVQFNVAKRIEGR